MKKKNKHRIGRSQTLFRFAENMLTQEEIQQNVAMLPERTDLFDKPMRYEATDAGRCSVERMGFFHAMMTMATALREAYDDLVKEPDALVAYPSVEMVEKTMPERITLMLYSFSQMKPPSIVVDEQHFRKAYTTGYLEGHQFMLFAVEHGVMGMLQEFSEDDCSKIVQAFAWAIYSPDVKTSDFGITDERMFMGNVFIGVLYKRYLEGVNPGELFGITTAVHD